MQITVMFEFLHAVVGWLLFERVASTHFKPNYRTTVISVSHKVHVFKYRVLECMVFNDFSTVFQL